MKSPPESDGKTKVEEGIEKDAHPEMTGVMIDVEDKMGIKARIGLALSAKIPILPSAISAIAVKSTGPGAVEEETKEIQMGEAILGRRLETGTAPSAKIQTSRSVKNAIDAKPTAPGAVEEETKEIQMEEAILGRRLETGTAPSAKIQTSRSVKNAIDAKPTDRKAVEEAGGEMNAAQVEETAGGRNRETGPAPSVKIRISPSATSVTSVKPTSLVLMLSPELKVDSGVEILDHKLVVLNEDEVGHQEVPADHTDLDSEALGVAVREVTDPEEVVVGAEFGPPQHSSCLNPSTTYGEQGGYALG